ncbi:hypothetical protein, conserved [Leishmania tarentolae]|uniref:BAR domain-containing protein n=1 Tax=Leishmania tarentolae TaxID=5689 RepID=A0A640KPW0_LEITA|nr:hypothetical protein, conserved [Leishmania tarentolae]
MSLQHDFVHRRELDDMRAIRAAITSFSGDMTKMMMLMKELGTTLEQLSHSFDALTSLSFTNDGVKQYVHHFSEEVTNMKEGIAFRNYNKLVHEEVLLPVEHLKASLKAAEKASRAEKNAFDEYKKAKRRVDQQEREFAEKRKPLDTSKSYPTRVQARNNALASLQNRKIEFEETFEKLVRDVEKVTATALKRYLELDASYMTSVIGALTSTDPTVEEAVSLYRQEQRQRRQNAIKQRCVEVNAELGTSCVSQGHRLDAHGMSGGLHDSLDKPTSRFQEHNKVSSGQALCRNTSWPGVPTLNAAAASPTDEASTTAATTVVSAPRLALEGNTEEEEFGSVSEVGTAGRRPPPLYTFSHDPPSVVSSALPQHGYIASLNAALTTEFMTRMEAKSIAASEVYHSYQAQK